MHQHHIHNIRLIVSGLKSQLGQLTEDINVDLGRLRALSVLQGELVLAGVLSLSLGAVQDGVLRLKLLSKQKAKD